MVGKEVGCLYALDAHGHYVPVTADVALGYVYQSKENEWTPRRLVPLEDEG